MAKTRARTASASLTEAYDRASLEAMYERVTDARSVDWGLVLKHVGAEGRPRQRHVKDTPHRISSETPCRVKSGMVVWRQIGKRASHGAAAAAVASSSIDTGPRAAR